MAKIYFLQPKLYYFINYRSGIVLEILKDKDLRVQLFGNAFQFSLEEDAIPKLIVDQKKVIYICLAPREKIPRGESLFVWPVKKRNDVLLMVSLNKSAKKQEVIHTIHERGYNIISPREALALILKGISLNASQLAHKAEEYGEKAIKLYIAGNRDARKYGMLCMEFIRRVIATVEYVSSLLTKANLVDKKLEELNNSIRKRVIKLKEKMERYITIE